MNGLLKRTVDLLLAMFGLAILSPVLVSICLICLITQGWPIFFVQERVGRFGKPFRLLKFRTMRADNRGSLVTVAGDSRITPLGSLLRRFKFDELPQLFNVLIGDMSFVGPRPEVERYTKLYTEQQKRVLDVRPGITDPASLIYFNESEVLGTQKDPERYYIEVLMPEKIRINLLYVGMANLGLDLWIILATIARIFGVRVEIRKRLEANA